MATQAETKSVNATLMAQLETSRDGEEACSGRHANDFTRMKVREDGFQPPGSCRRCANH